MNINNDGTNATPLSEPFRTFRIGFDCVKEKVQTVARIVAACVRELFSFIALVALYFVSQTWFDPKEADIEKDETGKARQQPILLVHGYLHNSSGWIYHRHRLNRKGFKNVFTVDLGAFPNKSIAQYADVVAKKVDEIRKITGRDDISLIGHSMGGLVSSHFALNIAEQKGVTVPRVITLNSPLRGTKISVIGLGACARDMEFESDYVKGLSEKIEASKNTLFTHFASSVDCVVFPFNSALNGNDPNDAQISDRLIVADDLGHGSILFSNRTIDREIEILNPLAVV